MLMSVCLNFSGHVFEFNSYVNIKPCNDIDNPPGVRVLADVVASPSPIERVTR